MWLKNIGLVTFDEFYLDEVYQFIDDVKNSKLEAACNNFIEDCLVYTESESEK